MNQNEFPNTRRSVKCGRQLHRHFYWACYLGIVVAVACIGLPVVGLMVFRLSQNSRVYPEPSEIVGNWRADYSANPRAHDRTGIEIITFGEDGTFIQQYSNDAGFSYVGLPGEWRIDEDGYIHLEDGLWFPLGSESAVDAKTDGMVLSLPIHGERTLVDLESEILLLPVNYDGLLRLRHLPVGDLDSPLSIELVKQTLTPSP